MFGQRKKRSKECERRLKDRGRVDTTKRKGGSRESERGENREEVAWKGCGKCQRQSPGEWGKFEGVVLVFSSRYSWNWTRNTIKESERERERERERKVYTKVKQKCEEECDKGRRKAASIERGRLWMWRQRFLCVGQVSFSAGLGTTGITANKPPSYSSRSKCPWQLKKTPTAVKERNPVKGPPLPPSLPPPPSHPGKKLPLTFNPPAWLQIPASVQKSR